MKSDKDIINDALMARVRELEAHQEKLAGDIEKLTGDIEKLTGDIDMLNIDNYLYSLYVFKNRAELLNGFAAFVESNYKDCAHSFALEHIEPRVIRMLNDLTDDLSDKGKKHFSEVFSVIQELETAK